MITLDHDEWTAIGTASTLPEIANGRSVEMEKTLLTLVEDVAKLKGVKKTLFTVVEDVAKLKVDVEELATKPTEVSETENEKAKRREKMKMKRKSKSPNEDFTFFIPDQFFRE